MHEDTMDIWFVLIALHITCVFSQYYEQLLDYKFQMSTSDPERYLKSSI